MGESVIEIKDWADLRGLPLAMDEVGEQAVELVEHATTWVCRSQGFEPSPVCVLRPIAEAMDLAASAFDEVGREFAERWSALREGVVAATAGLASSDDRVAAGWVV